MSDPHEFHLYKVLGTAGRPSLEPFFQMLWEHGLSFTPISKPQALTWSEAWLGTCHLYADGDSHDIPLRDATALLSEITGCLTLFDKQAGYSCWIDWMTSPGGQPLLSLNLEPPAWATQKRFDLGWYTTTDPETYLLANYQQGIVGFLHWSALCCQWFAPELAGSYDWRDMGGYHFPEHLLSHLDEQTFPARQDWGWMMYLPAQVITPDLLLDLMHSPEMTIHSLMPTGIQVYQLPSLYHYETRAGYEMEDDPITHASLETKGEAAIVETWHENVRKYERAITLFQAARHAQGESMARWDIKRTTESIFMTDRHPVRDDSMPSPERQDELEAAYRAQQDTTTPYQEVRIWTVGEVQWILQQRQWSGELELPAGMRRANLSKARLMGVNLNQLRLNEANLQGANLLRAHLSDAQLRRANLSQAYLGQAECSGIDCSEANLSGANLSSANLQSAHLTATNLREAHLLRGDLGEADLTGADLSGALLWGAKLHGARLHEANLSGARLVRANLSGVDFRHSLLTDAIIAQIQGTPLWPALPEAEQLALHEEMSSPSTSSERLQTFFRRWPGILFVDDIAANPNTPVFALTELASQVPAAFLRNPVLPQLFREDPTWLTPENARRILEALVEKNVQCTEADTTLVHLIEHRAQDDP